MKTACEKSKNFSTHKGHTVQIRFFVFHLVHILKMSSLFQVQVTWIWIIQTKLKK